MKSCISGHSGGAWYMSSVVSSLVLGCSLVVSCAHAERSASVADVAATRLIPSASARDVDREQVKVRRYAARNRKAAALERLSPLCDRKKSLYSQAAGF